MKTRGGDTRFHHRLKWLREKLARNIVFSKMVSYLPQVYPALSVWLILSSIMMLYFVLMDINLYITLQHWNGLRNSSTYSMTSYSPFNPLTMKLLMMNEINHYIVVPAAEYFDWFTGISSTFITPNMVSWFHVLVAILSGKLMISENQTMRRIGAFLYVVRDWLDSLDGVVFRAQRNTRLFYKSYKNTSGWVVDTVADTLGGIILTYAVYVTAQRTAVDNKSCSWVLPWKQSQTTNTEKPAKTCHLIIKIALFGITLALSGLFWDYFIAEYGKYYEGASHNTRRGIVELLEMKTLMMWCIIWFWKMLCAQAFVDYALIAVCMDKTWPFLQLVQNLLFPCLLVLALVSRIHLDHVIAVISAVPIK